MKSMITAEDWSPSGKLYGMMVHLSSALSKLTKHKSFEEFKKKKLFFRFHHVSDFDSKQRRKRLASANDFQSGWWLICFAALISYLLSEPDANTGERFLNYFYFLVRGRKGPGP